jgi:hypothetical protein
LGLTVANTVGIHAAMGKSLNWDRARPKGPSLSIKDEAETFRRDSGARFIKRKTQRVEVVGGSKKQQHELEKAIRDLKELFGAG